MTGLLDELAQRGLIHQASSSELQGHLDAGRVTAYIGFDPTAASLHVGSLAPVLMLVRLQRAGHRPIAILGGGTGLIGDPSGKQGERLMLTREKLRENLAGIRAQLERFLDFSGDGALLIDNAEWLERLSLINFLRDIGKHFSINAMIARDSVRTRLEQRDQGISFTEFAYMLMQAYDFLHLHDRHGCTLQMGGSDQWGNIVAGIDLIRRVRGREAYALTFPLVTRADGQKFGKSERGNVWLDPALTSPYEFYQFWRNGDDRDVVGHLKSLSLLPLGEVEAVAEAHLAAPERRLAQQALAEHLTVLVHGDEALRRVKHTTSILFGGGDLRELSATELAECFAQAPSTTMPADALGGQRAALVTLLTESGLCGSRSRARHDIQAGAVTINHIAAHDIHRVLAPGDLLAGAVIVLTLGRRNHHIIRIAG